jgi:4a-hydroxytetrahydrobiopterin dehydratase
MPLLSDGDVAQRLARLTGWSREGASIRKDWKFNDFKGSMLFVNHVAWLAETADHHPDILVSYSKVTLTLSSHDAGGLTERDFALAERIDG